MNVIYAATALNLSPHSSRCWGWFLTKEDAEACIRADNNDLFFENGTFSHAVIEEIGPGFMGGLDERPIWWFKADHLSDGTYVITALETCPPEWEGVCAFAMG
jgi:hypothetical protein